MRFAQVGRTYQLRIETADDLAEVLTLDESLWVATSAPASAFRCDQQFLKLVDTDHNGRIYTFEVRQAIRWLLDRLSDPSRLGERTDTLPLSAIPARGPQGRALLNSAHYVLVNLGEHDAEAISLNQIRSFMADAASLPLNGDGVITPLDAPDAQLAGFVQDAMQCVGTVKDASGEDGIGADGLARFMEAVRAYLDWKEKGRIPEGQPDSAMMPLGEHTPSAWTVCQAHADKVDVFFAQCRALSFEPAAAARMGLPESELEALNLSEADGVLQYLNRSPIARPSPDAMLSLREEDINPAYREWVGELKEQVLGPALGRAPDTLSEADWQRVARVLSPYVAYLQEKKGAEVEGLPEEELLRYRDGPFAEGVQKLIEADKEVAAVLEGVREVERLLLYHQNLMSLVNNFVSFPRLYSKEKRALFEMGSAVIDGRWYNFALRADDLAAHSAIAKQSGIFVLYLEVSLKGAEDKFCVVVPATSGTKGNLSVGKRGVFFDTNGKEYDARVVQIIENPISLREALTAPFVRLWRFIVGKIEGLSTAAEQKLEKGVEQAAAAAATQAAPQPAPQAAAAPTAIPGGPAGLIVGLSVGAAALGSAFAFIVKTFAELGFVRLGMGVLGVVLAVLVPLTVAAISKLRRQDLSALLEACGWAINARMRLDRGQRRWFTARVPYPAGAEGTPRRHWVRIVILVAMLGALLYGAIWGIRRWTATRAPQQTRTMEQADTQPESPTVEDPGQPATP